MLEKIAYLAIGSAAAVILMTVFADPRTAPATQCGVVQQDVCASAVPVVADDVAVADMAVMHQHPARAVTPDLPVPAVSHLVFPDILGGYNIQILPRNFEFTPAAINRAVRDNQGHAHIYVNDVKISRVYGPWFHLPGAALQSGENWVKVTLNANDHSEWAVNGVVIASTVRVVAP